MEFKAKQEHKEQMDCLFKEKQDYKEQQGLQGTDGTQGTDGVKGDIGAQGTDGVKGDDGAQGTDGTFGGASFDYTFSTTVPSPAADPGTGIIQLDNATQTSATEAYIDITDDDGNSIQSFLVSMKAVTSAIKGHMRIASRTDSTQFLLYPIDDLTDNTGWWTLDLDTLSSSGGSAFTNSQDIIISFTTVGDRGDKGSIGAQGIQGIQGTKGDDGAQGIQGIQGITGIQGIQGTDGAQGTDGEKGNTGEKGDIGAQGAVGLKGDNKGSQGAVGVKGEKGQFGEKGLKGDNKGSQGAQGDKGDDGAQGIQGIQGVQGTKGDDGAQGIQGITGIQGTDGQKGNAELEGNIEHNIITMTGGTAISGSARFTYNSATSEIGLKGGNTAIKGRSAEGRLGEINFTNDVADADDSGISIYGGASVGIAAGEQSGSNNYDILVDSLGIRLNSQITASQDVRMQADLRLTDGKITIDQQVLTDAATVTWNLKDGFKLKK